MEQRIRWSAAVSEEVWVGVEVLVAMLSGGHYDPTGPMVLSAGGGLWTGPLASLLFILLSAVTVHPATPRPRRADTLLRR